MIICFVRLWSVVQLSVNAQNNDVTLVCRCIVMLRLFMGLFNRNPKTKSRICSAESDCAWLHRITRSPLTEHLQLSASEQIRISRRTNPATIAPQRSAREFHLRAKLRSRFCKLLAVSDRFACA
jgi:hypothetical protein